jgi:ACS family hexuronate transporter-like MFS transporter
MTGFASAYLLGSPIAGALVDRLGARRTYAAAAAVWSLVAGAHALAASFGGLLLARSLLGLVEAPAVPAAAQAIRRSLPLSRRPLAYGLLSAGQAIGVMAAAWLAVALNARFGFRYAFLGAGALGFVWLPMWLYFSRSLVRREGDANGELQKGRAWISTVTNPAVLSGFIALLGVAPSLVFAPLWISQYLSEVWAVPVASSGRSIVFPALCFDLGALGFGWFLSRRRARGASAAPRGALYLAAGLASSLAAAPFAPSPGVAVVCFAVAAFGGAGTGTLVMSELLERVPLGQTSSVAGMLGPATALASIFTSPLVGAALDRTHSYSLVFFALSIPILPATAFFLAREPRRSFDSESHRE